MVLQLHKYFIAFFIVLIISPISGAIGQNLDEDFKNGQQKDVISLDLTLVSATSRELMLSVYLQPIRICILLIGQLECMEDISLKIISRWVPYLNGINPTEIEHSTMMGKHTVKISFLVVSLLGLPSEHTFL